MTELAAATVATANGIMNIAPPGVDPKEWKPPYAIGRLTDRELALSDLAAGKLDAIIEVDSPP